MNWATFHSTKLLVNRAMMIVSESLIVHFVHLCRPSALFWCVLFVNVYLLMQQRNRVCWQSLYLLLSVCVRIDFVQLT